ncbi:MAG TPA: aldo/keto reductase [Verrucomicrobiae bacterium]|nr:aldo/keto reductase [Verrucomicrobiae bacterium]
MQTISLGPSPLKSSRLAYGCWRIADDKNNPGAGRRAVIAAYEAGYTLFDNADVYGRGEAEKILGTVLKEISGMRERVVVLTKCGVRHGGHPNPDSPNRWDFSAEHILNSCEQSLKRLGIETIDILMLHRPDFLADPHEIAKAFGQLQAAGKVRFFGVSNFRPSLVTALQKACSMPLILHQVEISLAKLDTFTDGTLDQCLAENITPMAWSPLAAGLIGTGAKRLLQAQKGYRPEIFLADLEAIAAAHGTNRTVIALSWLLKHPSRIIPIIGSANPDRIREATKAVDLELSREEWYRLLNAARGEPLP